MITINSGKLSIPEKERFIGFTGDNLHSTKQFIVENVANENCIYRLYLKFDDGTVNYFVLDSKVENSSTILTWNILEEHIFKSGIVNAQIKSIYENGETYHTSWDYFLVAHSAEFFGEFKAHENAEFLRYEKELNEIYRKISNTDLSSFVPGYRTIAGLSLSSDISENDLYEALSVYPIILKDHAPTSQEGVTGNLCIDTTSNDLYYCCNRTLSGYNWIKLSSSSGNPNGLSKAEINNNGELVLSYNDGSTSNLGIVVGKDGKDGADGIDGKTPVKGIDYFTEEDKAEIINDVLSESDKTSNIPAYWIDHLEERISTIKALQDEGGKDCFSFVVMTDIHWAGNIGKKSPQLAKYIMDRCGIKRCLILGDTQTRGAWNTKEQTEAELSQVSEALSIIDGKLRVQGNHDGSWGVLDNEYYPYNFTPYELYNRIYRPIYVENNNAKSDSIGTAYYIDDDTEKVRFIMLNTHCNKYAENENGSVKYNNMRVFRFTQSQYDFLVNDALLTVPEGYCVVIGGHAPISNLYDDLFGGTNGETKTMRGVLTAYANKTTYSREWPGTATGEPAYTNIIDITSNDWLTSYRINSSNQLVSVTNAPDLKMTNFIDVSNKTILHIKGLNILDALTESTANYNRVVFYDENKEIVDSIQLTNYSDKGFYSVSDYDADVTLLNLTNIDAYFTHINLGTTVRYFRLCGVRTVTEDADIIVTADEEISQTAHGYDYVNVNVDFSEAKGDLIGYFSGHAHADYNYLKNDWGLNIITTRCDAKEENDSTLNAERIAGTTTEQSFDVFTVNKAQHKIYATKIGAGNDRIITY